MDDYSDVASKLSDVQLVGVLLNHADYHDEMIQQVKKQLEDRFITADQQKELENAYLLENTKLSIGIQLMYFLLSWTIYTWLELRKYKNRGELQKFIDAKVATKYGLIFYLFLFAWFFVLKKDIDYGFIEQ